VFHHAADDDVLAVGDGVDVQFDRVVEELVDEDRLIGRDANRFLDVLFQVLVVVHHVHRAPAEDVGGTHEDGVADVVREFEGLGFAGRGAAFRLGDTALVHQAVEAVAVLREVHGVDAGAQNLTVEAAAIEFGLQRVADVDRGLSAELHHHAVGVGRFDHVSHLLGCNRLEKEAVGGVVVRRHRLGVVVDDVGVDALLAERLDGVYRTVVELDALPDADGTAADDDDALHVTVDAEFARRGRPLERAGDVLRFARGVVVRRLGGELSRTGVDLLVRPAGDGRLDGAHVGAGRRRDFGVGDALDCRVGEVALGGVRHRVGDACEPLDVPLLDAGQVDHVLDGVIAVERLEDGVRAVGRRPREILALQRFVVHVDPVDGRVVLRRPEGLQERFLEGPAD